MTGPTAGRAALRTPLGVLLGALLGTAAAAACAHPAPAPGPAPTPAPAPPHAPSTTAQPYAVLRRDTLAALAARLAPEGRRDLVGAAGGLQTVAYVQHVTDRPDDAEVHDASDDYHVILDGSAVYRLGGRLVAPREVRPGEWRAREVEGGEDVTLGPGDVLFVPRGTVHRRDVRGRRVALFLVKSYQDTQPARPAARR